MSKRLELYLHRASRGVSSAQRTVIQAELRGNILLRASELQLLGLTHAQGVERALVELGAPSHISHGMLWIYTAPRAIRWILAPMLVAWCCVTPLNPITVYVKASVTTDDSGKLTGINLETDSFSSALATAGIGLYDPALRTNFDFTTAHSWDWAIRDNLIQRSLTTAKFGLTTNLELLQALRVLCNVAAHVTLESPSSSVVFRVTWKGSTARITLNLDPHQALEFHKSVASSFKHPCEQ